MMRGIGLSVFAFDFVPQKNFPSSFTISAGRIALSEQHKSRALPLGLLTLHIKISLYL
jgi:hypothetical protein